MNTRVDLMHDPRIRAVIKEQLYADLLIGPVVVTLVCLVSSYQFVQWPETKLLVCTLVIWWLNSLLLLALYIYHRRRPFEIRNLPAQSSRYLNLLHINLVIDKLGIGVAALLMYIVKPEWALTIVCGHMMYMYGTFFKNMSYAKVAQYFPALMLVPLIIYLLLKGGLYGGTLAFYFSLNVLVLYKYARSIAAAIQLPIKQRLELEVLTMQLNLERDRADAANSAKSHFFTAASHDARQPLQAISLLFQSLRKSTQINKEDTSIIDKIDVNLNTIRNLFDRVLDISRIDSGNVEPHLQAIPLQSLFDKFDAQFGELAASKGLWLRFVPTQAWVKQDAELLDRMLSNLVHNAIKYTPFGGVWVAWRETRGRLEVRDSGLGISEADQKNIWNEFAQVNNPARNNEAGLGLGLSIVKRLADLTLAPLGLNSQTGKGSTFWLKLNVVSSDLINDPSLISVATSRWDLDISPLVGNEASNRLDGMHIFYVDDEPQLRELFTQLLTEAGATVYSCADVDEATHLLASKALLSVEKMDVVLTDYRLGSSGTGLDVVRAARSFGDAHLPAVLLTGDSAVKDLISIQQLPNATLLHKPVDFERLTQELLKAVEARPAAKRNATLLPTQGEYAPWADHGLRGFDALEPPGPWHRQPGRISAYD